MFNHIMKLDLLPFCTEFIRHEMQEGYDQQVTKLYDFLKNVSTKRAENLRIMIEPCNSKTEESVKQEISKL